MGRAEALVLLAEATLEVSKALTPSLSKKWVWLEVGIIDDEGVDAVPRVRCPVVPHHQQPSSVLLVKHRLEHRDRGESRLLHGLTQYILAGTGEYRLAVWARADGPLLFDSSLE